MRTLQVITSLCRHSGVKRTAAIAAIAMLASASVDAAPRKTIAAAENLYVKNYARIVSDDHFRANYQQWRRNFPDYNWTTDGCSRPANLTHYADNFYWPCVQHDFGYRNSRKAHRHDEATRKFIDDNLLRHTKQLCSHYSLLAKPGCYAASEVFYKAVRVGARSHF